MKTLHYGRTDEDTFAWCLKNVMLPLRGRLGPRQVSLANLPARRAVVGFIKTELKNWGEHLIAVSIFSSLQYRITIGGNVSHPKGALQAANAFIGLFEENNLERLWRS